MQVPFLDLKAQYQSIKPQIDLSLQAVIDDAAFAMGPHLKAFEEKFAAYQGLKYMLGTNSGTSAIAISLLALKHIAEAPWPDDEWEAIVPANTFIATAEAVVQAGGRPVFCDVREDTYNMDVAQAERMITPRTRVLIPVHLFGQAAEMDTVMRLAARRGLKVVEDCAQIHGGKYRHHRQWKPLGSFGQASAFSFYPGKNLGAYGDGGAVGTDNRKIERFVRMYRDHGSEVKYEHEFVGSTDRLDSLQAAVLNVKLNHLDQWNVKRRENAELYKTYFNGVDEVILPFVPEWAEPVWHLFVIRVKNRSGLQKFLQEKGIGTGLHYKSPLHQMPAFAHLDYRRGDYPVTEKVMKEIISLPMFPELTDEQIRYVVETVKEFLVLKK